MSASSPTLSARTSGWLQTLRVFWHPRVRVMLFLGFSAGLPLMLVFGTLSFWLREAGIERATIGFLSWVTLVYGLKWAWAPLVDRLPLPLLTAVLGRRRGWLLLAQVAVTAGLAAMALSDPREDLTRLALCALAVAFASATQDIVIDAYRIESAPVRLQGAMASAYMAGYRLAMLLAQAGALAIAAVVDPSADTYEHAPWTVAYLSMAAAMGVGLVTTLLIAEPEVRIDRGTVEREARGLARIERLAWLPVALRRIAAWLSAAVIGPFVDFIGRYRWQALLILALIATYRISDVVLGVISSVFYVDIGFTKLEVAGVTKVFGVIMLLVGAESWSSAWGSCASCSWERSWQPRPICCSPCSPPWGRIWACWRW
jgi:PAT family beta-lactamase induction signal transducer AmpG